VALPVDLGRGSGITRDVSEVGVLFDTELAFQPGQALEFALVLGEFESGGRYRVRCVGEVVRVEPRGAGFAVAVRLSSYSL
jgi:hypothetical protein